MDMIYMDAGQSVPLRALKRNRSSNWNEQEKKVLRNLVLERSHIIENKDTSSNTNAAKKLAWEEVLSCYNVMNIYKRDLAQLHNQWRNMKNHAKKSEFAFRRARSMTGGGPPPSSPPPEDQEIMNALPNEFTVDSNTFDSDSVFTEQHVKKKAPGETVDLINYCELATPLPVSVFTKQHVKKNAPGETVDHNYCELSTPLPVSVFTKQGVKKNAPGETVDLINCELATPLPVKDIPAPSAPEPEPVRRNKKQKLGSKNDCCSSSHEHQIFLLAKKAREEAMLRERELHEKRMTLLALEEEYWRAKITKL